MNYTTTELTLKLNFENMAFVSSRPTDPDAMMLIIYGFQFFADTQGDYMLPPTILSPKVLP